eukprot:m.66291 g.66291  ORF g.66291 m.66291 type:complete len:91 (-) comp13585_c0_seq3:2377-2649(-)
MIVSVRLYAWSIMSQKQSIKDITARKFTLGEASTINNYMQTKIMSSSFSFPFQSCFLNQTTMPREKKAQPNVQSNNVNSKDYGHRAKLPW